jgi:putative intracellular protease/amidase
VLVAIPLFERLTALDAVGHRRGEVRTDNGMLGMTMDNDDDMLDRVREVHQRSRFTTSVCTGALVLAAAGSSPSQAGGIPTTD